MADGRHAAPGDLIGERIGGRFVVERLIGQGPLSTAFRAHDERLHRRVTVKLFHAQHADDEHVIEAQLEAASAVARLSHEHLAIVIDRGEHEGLPLVVLEYVRGENLAERIERYAPLAAPEVIGYATAIAKALAYAHAEGVVHGNLRPENVLLTEDRSPKLVDFGGGSYTAQLTGDPYIAPERRSLPPGAPVDPTDDIYALGVLVFAALTEQAPPAGGLETAQLQMLRPDLAPRLAAAVATALAINPLERQQSMRQLAADLGSGARDEVVESAAAAGRRGDQQETRAWTAGEVADIEARNEWSDLDEHTDQLVLDAVTGPMVRSPRRAVRRPSTPRETSARLLAWSMVVAPLLVLVLVGVMIAGERRADTRKGGAGAESTGSSGFHRVLIDDASTYDPFGDGVEHPELVSNVFDPSPETSWNSEGYDSPDMVGKKGDTPGVGVIVHLERPADVTNVEVRTTLEGWRVQVYAADAPATSFEEWTPVLGRVPVKSAEGIDVTLEDGDTDTLLLWITRLSLDPDETDKFRARIGGIRVYASK